MTFATVARSLGVAFLAASLAACGGGSGFGPATGTGGGNSGGSTPPAAKVSISFDHAQINAANPGTATVTLDANGTGQSVANQVIEITTTAGNLVPASGLVLTDTNGKATIKLQDAGVATAGTLTAALSDDPTVTGKATFNLAGDATPGTAAKPLLTVSFASNAITGASPGTAMIQLSANGTALNVASQVIQVTTTSGTLDPASGMVLTDGTGKASITLKDGGTKTAGILTAKLFSDNTVTADAAFTMDGSGQQVVQPTLTMTLAPTAISATNPGTATITLNANGTGLSVANQVIQVTTTAGTLDPASGAVLTDSTGKAAITLKDNGTKTAGTLTASLSSNAAVTAQATFSLAGDGNVAPSQPKLTVAFANNAISAANPGTATITLNANGTGLSVANQVIQVTTTAGTLDPASGMVLTNGSGQATITLKDNGIKTAGVLSAQLNGNGAVAGQASFSLAGDATPGTAAKPLLTVSFASNAITGASPGTATIQLSANGTALNVASQVIQVTTTSGTLDPASGMVLTDGTGKVSITLKDGGTKTAGILTATLNSDSTVSGSAAFQMDGSGLPKLSVIALIDSTNPANTDYGTATQPITTPAPATVQVVLTDASNNPIANANVGFALSSAVGALSAPSALTNASGIATVALSAGNTQGAGTLTATYIPPGGKAVTSAKSFAVEVGGGTGPQLSTPDLTDAGNNPNGTTANPITDTSPATVRVTLSGVPDPANQVIAFTLIGPAGVGALNPAAGTALTDGSGVALITLKSGTAAGAATLKASYTAGSATVTSQRDFTTLGAGQAVQLQLALGSGSGGSFVAGEIAAPTGLVSGSTASVIVNVVDTGNGNAIYTDAPVQVTFTSACFQGGRARFNPAVATTISGAAFTSYQPANGCTNDTISASAIVNGKNLTAATPSFAVPQSPANAIQFVSAVPDKIGVKGASGAGTAETSILTFLISDQNGNPVGPGVGVTFTVQTPAGGFGIANGTASVVNTQTAQTDNSGKVSVTVNSGTVPMIGTIKAALTATPTIFGTGSVAVQQGVATEDRFVIAVATLNPAAGNHVGVTDNVVVRAADRVGNWVPDGTIIHFETKLGDIGASCTTVNGTCSVTWTSQASQPLLFDVNRATSGCSAFTLDELFRHGLPSQPWDMQCGKHDRYGVNVITAWTTGEESFSDTNGNNVFDNGEPFVDLGESFNDNNLNGIHDPTNGAFSEDYQDLDTNGTYDGPNGLYNGLACPAGATNCQRSLIDVRRGTTMVLSTDSIQMRVWDGSSVPVDLAISNPTAWGTGILTSATPEATQLTSASSAITAAVADLNGNAPAIGTSISVTVTKIDPSSKAAVVGPSTCTIGNAVDHMECVFSINPGLAGDKFTITATSGADANIAVSRTLTVQ